MSIFNIKLTMHIVLYLLIGLSFDNFFLGNNRKLFVQCSSITSKYLNHHGDLKNSKKGVAHSQSESMLKSNYFNLIAKNNNYDNDDNIDDEEEDLDEKSSTVYSSSTSANSIQYMITNKMKKILHYDLGYTNDEINQMEPQIASVVIDRKLHRPAKGMPPGWIKQTSTNLDDDQIYKDNKPFIHNITKFLKKTMKVIVSNRIIHALSTITIVWYNQKSIKKVFGHIKDILSKPFISNSYSIIDQYPLHSKKKSKVMIESKKKLITNSLRNPSKQSFFTGLFQKKASSSSTSPVKEVVTHGNQQSHQSYDQKVMNNLVNLKTLSNIQSISIYDRIQLLRMKIFNI